jgi:mannan endo-1,4-beta-mannosidase
MYVVDREARLSWPTLWDDYVAWCRMTGNQAYAADPHAPEVQTMINKLGGRFKTHKGILWVAHMRARTKTGPPYTSVFEVKAMRQDRILYANLQYNSGKKMFFGHQDATGYGVGWSNDDDRSDVKDVSGSYPALGAWGLAGISNGQDYSRDKYRVEKFYNLGGLNTYEWHCGDPYNGKFYQTEVPAGRNIVADILPGGPKHDWLKTQLKNVAVFFKDLKGENGESVPVIFRPWHEHTGNWFWWGTGNCSKQEYIDLWKFTKSYLNDSCQVHNLLFAYSPDRFSTKTAYLDRWPGDNIIDIMGFDDYWDLRHNNTDMAAFTNSLTLLGEMAEEKGKVCALTEVGQEKIETINWYTQTLLKGILTNEKTKKVAYACVWRNANATHHYAPYPGHPAENDFISFYNHDFTVFMNDVPELYETLQTTSTGSKFINRETSDIILFPNPTSGFVGISEGNLFTKVEIYNTGGQLVLQKTNTSSVDLSSFQNGVYFLRLKNKEGEEVNRKILLQKN